MAASPLKVFMLIVLFCTFVCSLTTTTISATSSMHNATNGISTDASSTGRITLTMPDRTTSMINKTKGINLICPNKSNCYYSIISTESYRVEFEFEVANITTTTCLPHFDIINNKNGKRIFLYSTIQKGVNLSGCNVLALPKITTQYPLEQIQIIVYLLVNVNYTKFTANVKFVPIHETSTSTDKTTRTITTSTSTTHSTSSSSSPSSTSSPSSPSSSSSLAIESTTSPELSSTVSTTVDDISNFSTSTTIDVNSTSSTSSSSSLAIESTTSPELSSTVSTTVDDISNFSTSTTIDVNSTSSTSSSSSLAIESTTSPELSSTVSTTVDDISNFSTSTTIDDNSTDSIATTISITSVTITATNTTVDNNTTGYNLYSNNQNIVIISTTVICGCLVLMIISLIIYKRLKHRNNGVYVLEKTGDIIEISPSPKQSRSDVENSYNYLVRDLKIYYEQIINRTEFLVNNGTDTGVVEYNSVI